MRGLDLGLDRFKFFPAEASGGIPALKALSAPFANVRFCPTGGIRADNAADGWRWNRCSASAEPGSIAVATDWDEVAERARAAAGITHLNFALTIGRDIAVCGSMTWRDRMRAVLNRRGTIAGAALAAAAVGAILFAVREPQRRRRAGRA